MSQYNDVFQVNYYEFYPECNTSEEDQITAFVLAESFEQAISKVKEKFTKDMVSVSIIAVCRANKVKIVT